MQGYVKGSPIGHPNSYHILMYIILHMPKKKQKKAATVMTKKVNQKWGIYLRSHKSPAFHVALSIEVEDSKYTSTSFELKP